MKVYIKENIQGIKDNDIENFKKNIIEIYNKEINLPIVIKKDNSYIYNDIIFNIELKPENLKKSLNFINYIKSLEIDEEINNLCINLIELKELNKEDSIIKICDKIKEICNDILEFTSNFRLIVNIKKLYLAINIYLN